MQQSAAGVKRGTRGKEVRATQIDIQMGFILRNGPREPRIVCTIMRFYLRNDVSCFLNRRSTTGVGWSAAASEASVVSPEEVR